MTGARNRHSWLGCWDLPAIGAVFYLRGNLLLSLADKKSLVLTGHAGFQRFRVVGPQKSFLDYSLEQNEDTFAGQDIINLNPNHQQFAENFVRAHEAWSLCQ